MPLQEALIKKLQQPMEPDSLVHFRFRGRDVAVKTNARGEAVQVFIGDMQENGHIRGERYTRVRVEGPDGRTLKDHWDRKGKAS